MNDGVERRKRDTHVRRMRRHARARRAENRVHPVAALDRITSFARRSLVASGGVVVEVEAARSLHDVPAHGRHIADLARRATEQRAGQHRKVDSNIAIGRDRRVLRRRADENASVLTESDLL